MLVIPARARTCSGARGGGTSFSSSGFVFLCCMGRAAEDVGDGGAGSDDASRQHLG